MAAAAGDALGLPYLIYGQRARLTFPLLDADGDLVTGATTPDSEISKDQGTFADCTNEMTEIATASGMYYLDLIQAETQASSIAIIAKSATAGMKTTPLVIPIRRLPILRAGTAQAGAASTITIDSGASAKDGFYNGCIIQCANNSPANVQGQTRWIIDYVGSTKVATVHAAWGTNPSSATTFEVYAPDQAAVAGWLGKELADPTNNGVPETDMTHILGSAVVTTSAQLGVNLVQVKAQTVPDPAVTGVPKVDTTHWNGTAVTTPPSVDTTKIGGSTTAATRLARSTRAIALVTVGSSSTTTSIIASAIDPASSVNDQFNGRIITFDEATTTTALRGQATDITDYVHATLTFSCTALTNAPVSGDTFTVT